MAAGIDRPTRTQRGYVCLYMGDAQEGVIVARTRDLSRSGIFLQMAERPPLGAVRDLQFIWGGDTLRCAAQVTRHGHDGIAMRFVDADAVFCMALEEVIKPEPALEYAPLAAGAW